MLRYQNRPSSIRKDTRHSPVIIIKEYENSSEIYQGVRKIRHAYNLGFQLETWEFTT